MHSTCLSSQRLMCAASSLELALIQLKQQLRALRLCLLSLHICINVRLARQLQLLQDPLPGPLLLLWSLSAIDTVQGQRGTAA